MSKFITNECNTLKDTIKHLIQSSKELDFLVGYFVFSGFKEIYSDLDNDKPIKILIGMDVEYSVANKLQECYKEVDENSKKSRADIKKDYYRSIVEFYSKNANADNYDTKKSYEIFKRKIEEGTLEIRKTLEPNHAKMYLFQKEETDPVTNQETGKVIVGSSNLSYDGLKNRNEINVFLQDQNDYIEAKKIFDELWNSSVEVVNKNNKEDFYNKVIRHTWLDALPNPYLLYVKVLQEYFKTADEEICSPKELSTNDKKNYFDLKYQLDAIRDGVFAVKRHSGCIIADVVGLGKSIVASCIAKNLENQKVVKRTIIICPPHLEFEWRNYASDFCLTGYEVYTSGKIKKCATDYKDASDLLIIVDEAHRYRNETTNDYEDLKGLCLRNKVLLLSATPFNNRPQDIFSLIKLFQLPNHSTIKTVDNLANKMSELIREHKEIVKNSKNGKTPLSKTKTDLQILASKIRAIIEPVVIRRTRVDLEKIQRYKEDLKNNNIKFSIVNDPKCEYYNLGELSDLYISTLNTISPIGCAENKDVSEGFNGAGYKPLLYLKDDKNIHKKYVDMFDMENFEIGQKNMSLFMRHFLVRRFESSKYAFSRSIENVLNMMQRIAKWYELGIIPFSDKQKISNFDILDNLYEDSEDNDSGVEYTDVDNYEEIKEKDVKKIKAQLKINNKKYIESSDLKPEFINDLNKDIKIFSKLKDDWAKISLDPKFDYISQKISKSLKKEPDRKIIIFTEFADTADYLCEKFSNNNIKNVKVFEYTSNLANDKNRKRIKENFDAGIPASNQKDDFNVLIGTDAISEGMSLHRAGTIYNYDIPYNPTRVIQRVGRINRINKMVFKNLNIYNFFPTEVGETESKIKQITTFKMHLIQSIFGSDTKILTSDESINGYMTDQYKKKCNEEDSESWDLVYRKELDEIDKRIKNEAKSLPHKCKISRNGIVWQNKENNNDLFNEEKSKIVILFSKKGDSCRFSYSNGIDSGILYPEEALQLFRCSPEEKGYKISNEFWHRYESAKQSSGISNVVANSNPKINFPLASIKQLNPFLKNEDDKDYISKLCEVIKMDIVSGSKLKKIGKIKPSVDSVSKLKDIVSEQFIDSIIKKRDDVENQSEIILLSEELNMEKLI